MTDFKHLTTIDGGQMTWELKADDGDLSNELRRRISVIDGERRSALMLWKIPRGMEVGDAWRRNLPQEFMQCAGSSAGVTVEIRSADADGRFRLDTLGTDKGAVGQRPSEFVRWDGHRLAVRPDEIFDLQAAGDIFVAYLEDGKVPVDLTRRLAASS